MDGGLGIGLVEALAEGLAIDGDELPGGDLVQRCDPGEQATLELAGLDRLEDGIESVMRGDAAGEVEDLGQPGSLLAGPCGDGHEVVGPGDHGTQGHGHDVDERIENLAAARVGEAGEVLVDPSGEVVRHGGGGSESEGISVAMLNDGETERCHAFIIPNYPSWRNRPDRETELPAVAGG